MYSKDFESLRFFVLVLAATVFGGDAVMTPASAQQRNVPEAPRELDVRGFPDAGERTEQVFCPVDNPSTVQRWRVTCPEATSLDVAIADCCIPGDHFQVKVKTYDSRPNTAVATSPGPADEFGISARVYSYGGAPENPALDATVECSYLHGINDFGAASNLAFTPNAGTCTVLPLNPEDQIERSP